MFIWFLDCDGGLVSNGVCYFLGDKKEVFADAAVTCENYDAQLANLLDDAVYDEVIGYLREQAPKSCGGQGSNWFWTGVEYDFDVNLFFKTFLWSFSFNNFTKLVYIHINRNLFIKFLQNWHFL